MEPRNDWFPVGRNPWNDLFTASVMLELSKTLEIKEPRQLRSLKRKLSDLAEGYIYEIEFSIPQHGTAKAGILYKDKILWLRKNVTAPATLLSNSLSGENMPWLSTFPNLSIRSDYPAFYTIQQHMLQLVKWSTELERSIENHATRVGNVAPAARPNTDLKYALAYDLVAIYAKITGRQPSLVNSATVTTKRSQIVGGRTLSFVRLAAKRILNDSSAEMIDETRAAIKKHKAKSRS